MKIWTLVPAGVLLLAGCKDDAPKPEPATTAAATPDPKPAATHPAAKHAEEAPAKAPAAAAPAEAAPTAAAHSATPPTFAEWAAETREVGVKGSTALGCETKVLNGWFRCSCRGKNKWDGTPTKAVIKRGNTGSIPPFASGGVTSIVVPFVEGTSLEATFSFTNGDADLQIDWPRGSPMPKMIGAFQHSFDGTY